MIGRPVTALAAPGGAWSPLIAQLARASGYRTLGTSRPGINTQRDDPMKLRRIGIKGSMTADVLARYCRFNTRREVWRSALLDVPKSILGIERYARLRRGLFRLLRRRTSPLN